MSCDDREHYIEGLGAFCRCDFENTVSAIKKGVEPPEEIIEAMKHYGIEV